MPVLERDLRQPADQQFELRRVEYLLSIDMPQAIYSGGPSIATSAQSLVVGGVVNRAHPIYCPDLRSLLVPFIIVGHNVPTRSMASSPSPPIGHLAHALATPADNGTTTHLLIVRGVCGMRACVHTCVHACVHAWSAWCACARGVAWSPWRWWILRSSSGGADRRSLSSHVPLRGALARPAGNVR